MVEVLDLFNVRRGHQRIDFDLTLPGEGDQAQRWLIPAAFLSKVPIAPDLDVRYSDGSIVSAPVQRENMELTLAAMEQLHTQGHLDLDAHPDLRPIISDIVAGRPLVAQVAGIQLRNRIPEPPDFLRRLLDLLSDQFLLWIPVSGLPGEPRHFSLQRRQPRDVSPLLPVKGELREVTLDMALGPETIIGQSAVGRRTFDPVQGLERLLRVLGLAPISFVQEVREACRADSYHICLAAPRDFIVRGVRLARIRVNPEKPNERWLEELESEPDQNIQGRGSELAHVHFADRNDRAPLMVEALLAIRDGLTTLWALVVVLTAGLLWIFEHNLDPAIGSGHLEVAAAVLLVGPALVTAWAVRADEGEMLRNVLSGTRQLLMGSAALSVAATLALIGYAPFDWSPEYAIEWYAAISYAIAVLVVIGWSLSRGGPWFVYRNLLTSPKRNFWATALLTGLAAAIVVHAGLPPAAVGATLAFLGLGLAAISANRIGAKMGGGPRAFAPIAGIGATVAFLAAGCYLGYYDNVIGFDLLRPIVFFAEGALAVRAIAA